MLQRRQNSTYEVAINECGMDGENRTTISDVGSYILVIDAKAEIAKPIEEVLNVRIIQVPRKEIGNGSMSTHFLDINGFPPHLCKGKA